MSKALYIFIKYVIFKYIVVIQKITGGLNCQGRARIDTLNKYYSLY